MHVDILFLLKPVKFILTTRQFLLRMFSEKLEVALRYSLQFHICFIKIFRVSRLC